MKNLLTKVTLLALSSMTLNACQNFSPALPSQYQQNQNFRQQKRLRPLTLNRLNAFSMPQRRGSDWYEALNPQLQKYYQEAKGKSGQDLFKTLSQIISRRNKISSYGTAKSFMYATADNVQQNSRSGLFDSYSYQFIPGRGGHGGSYKERGDLNQDGASNDFINCEHTWPQSFFRKANPMRADIHHLFPTLSRPNNRRGHHPFGMTQGKVIYSTNGGSKLSVINHGNRSVEELARTLSLPPEEQISIMGGKLNAIFEPGDRQKGNTARAMFYFYMRYQNANIRSGDFEHNAFWASKVNTFRTWSEVVDPIDKNELKRHEEVFKKQGNRNPFIDIPQLASIIGEDVLRD